MNGETLEEKLFGKGTKVICKFPLKILGLINMLFYLDVIATLKNFLDIFIIMYLNLKLNMFI